MAIIGWYYLHENGSLLYKRELDGGTAADIRESPSARAMWPVEPEDRESAWNVVVEALALGADVDRVRELAAKWSCTDEDAAVYAERVGARLLRDGAAWCATRRDFADLQVSPAGYGDTALEALAELCKALGFRGGKTWNAHFRDLLAAPAPSPTPNPET
jgi:hypothetical protein